MNTGVTPNKEFFVAMLSSLSEKVVPWRRIVAFDDEVSEVSIQGDDLFVMTYKNTPRYKILRTSLKKPDWGRAEAVFPASAAVVFRMAAQTDALYVTTLEAGNYRTYRVDYRTKKSERLPLPYDGAAHKKARANV